MIASGIDHVLIATPELEASRVELQQLGFQVTPRARHERFGTANYLCVLEDSYLELIGIEHHEPAVRAVQQILLPSIESGGGIPALALATPDATAAYNALKAEGTNLSAPETWSRLADTEGGPRMATFTTLFVPAELSPGYTTFYCQHHTPDLIHQRRWQLHDNGAVALGSVGQRSSLPASEIELAYRHHLGDGSVTSSARRVLVKVGCHQMEFLPWGPECRYSIGLYTRSLDWISRQARHHARTAGPAALEVPLSTVPSVCIRFEVRA